MLNEDTYVAVPVLLRRHRLEPAAAVQRRRRPLRRRADAVRDGSCRRWRRRPSRRSRQPRPSVAVLADDRRHRTRSSPSGWLRWLLDKHWRLPHDDVTAGEIATGALAAADVLRRARRRRGRGGEGAGQEGRAGAAGAGWRRAAGWSASAAAPPWPARLGVTGATLASPTSDIPGSLVRASVAGGPLTAGVGSTVWNFVEYDPVLRAADPPPSRSPTSRPTFALSGFARGRRASWSARPR